MSSATKPFDRLREFGLSEYAARAYLALLELGTTEARDVSRLAKIPLAKIYNTLEQLQEKGLVIVSPESPKKYAPIPFRDYVDRLRITREEEARALAEARDELDATFPIVGTTEMNDRGGVVIVRGRRNVLDKLRYGLEDARHSVIIIASVGMLEREAHLRAALEVARSRGVRCRLVLPDTPAAHRRLDAFRPLAEVRLRPEEKGQVGNVAMAIFDAKRALMVHFIPDDASLYNGKDVGVVLEEVALVAGAASMVECAWLQATTVTTLVLASDAAQPPRGVPRDE